MEELKSAHEIHTLLMAFVQKTKYVGFFQNLRSWILTTDNLVWLLDYVAFGFSLGTQLYAVFPPRIVIVQYYSSKYCPCLNYQWKNVFPGRFLI